MTVWDDAHDRVRDDPALRAALETARAWGVSPRRFFGEDPAVRLEPLGPGWRVVADPEWNDEDRALALALTGYEAGLCPGCRHPLEETTDPDNEFRYKAQTPVRCHRCTASSVASEAIQNSNYYHPDALLLPIELRE